MSDASHPPAARSRLVVAASIVLLLAACSGNTATPTESAVGSTSPSAAPSAAHSGPPSTELSVRTEAEFSIEGADFPVVAFGAVWVVSAETEPAIVRIDPESNEVVAQIPVPGRGCNGATASPDAIWACASDGIARIDPATNTVTTVVDVSTFGQARLAFGAGSVWIFARLGDGVTADAVVRIDPATATVTATIPMDRPLGTMAFGFDALWVTSPDDGLLLRVDPVTDGVSVVRDDLTGPFVVAVGPDSLWVSLFGTDGASPVQATRQSPASIPPAVRWWRPS